MIRYLVILFSFFFANNFAQDIQSILSKVPLEEQPHLTTLFYRMMYHDHFSYTLFGDKPVSLSGDFELTPYENTLWGKQKCGGIFWKNWTTWEKYQSLFPIHNYLFIKEASINCENVVNIIFINKKQLVTTVNNNLKTFKEKLQRNITGEELLAEIETTKCFATIIKNDEVLWGILLGYGHHNASLYDERLQIDQSLYPDRFSGLPLKLSNFKDLSTMQEKHLDLNSKLRFFGDHHYSPLIANSVHFVADLEHEETKALAKKYQQLRGKISAIYRAGDFLEVTLSQLTSTDQP